jgi:hypothetical protein
MAAPPAGLQLRDRSDGNRAVSKGRYWSNLSGASKRPEQVDRFAPGGLSDVGSGGRNFHANLFAPGSSWTFPSQYSPRTS